MSNLQVPCGHCSPYVDSWRERGIGTPDRDADAEADVSLEHNTLRATRRMINRGGSDTRGVRGPIAPLVDRLCGVLTHYDDSLHESERRSAGKLCRHDRTGRSVDERGRLEGVEPPAEDADSAEGTSPSQGPPAEVSSAQPLATTA